MSGVIRLSVNRTDPRIAAKTLTRAEVDPAASNQHEFHAGRLRRLLGFDASRVEGTLTALIYTETDQEPHTSEGEFTLYEARSGSEDRDEWHLYYSAAVDLSSACPGDLLVLFRFTVAPDLHALVARAGTQLETHLRELLALGDSGALIRFTRGTLNWNDPSFTRTVTRDLLLPPEDTIHSISTDDPFVVGALCTGTYPTTFELASEAHHRILARLGHTADPDEILHEGLALETQLFYAIENALGQMELDTLLASSTEFAEVMQFALGKHQSRRSRRGYSLQHHTAFLLEAYGIPFEPQCETEPGEWPDFIIPNSREYHNSDYPPERLRMIGCKSRIRERWRQYLTEAARIREKYAVTLDEKLSQDLVRTMHDHSLRLFMPKRILEQHYSGSQIEAYLSTIGALIVDLKRVTET